MSWSDTYFRYVSGLLASLTILSSYHNPENKLPWHLLHGVFPLPAVQNILPQPDNLVICSDKTCRRWPGGHWQCCELFSLFKEGSALVPCEQHQTYSCCGCSFLTKMLSLSGPNEHIGKWRGEWKSEPQKLRVVSQFLRNTTGMRCQRRKLLCLARGRRSARRSTIRQNWKQDETLCSHAERNE